jgi:SAM-dependent methyltransferase
VLTRARCGSGPGFDTALAGNPARLVRCDGVEVELTVHRWRAAAGGEDDWLLDRCTGAVIDLGCGPGRLLAALAARGLPALGVDVSAVAQRHCHRRRVPMVRRDVFGPLPGEGTWAHVLLADGNIGIGGNPLLLLRRCTTLLRPGGTVLVETDPRPDALWRGQVRVRTGAGTGPPLPWACAGIDALTRIAAALGMRRTGSYAGRRSLVELRARAAGQVGRAGQVSVDRQFSVERQVRETAAG